MTHKCSPCSGTFETEEAYLNHECPRAEGAKPTSPDFLKRTTMPHYDSVAAAAQKRGDEKKETKE